MMKERREQERMNRLSFSDAVDTSIEMTSESNNKPLVAACTESQLTGEGVENNCLIAPSNGACIDKLGLRIALETYRKPFAQGVT